MNSNFTNTQAVMDLFDYKYSKVLDNMSYDNQKIAIKDQVSCEFQAPVLSMCDI